MKYLRLFACIAVLLLVSCDKFTSSIPNLPVNLTLYLDYEDRDLKRGQAHKIFNKHNTNPLTEATGFGGVLVYHGYGTDGMDAYFAFDLACPHEANNTVLVAVDDSEIYAVCPKCKSQYELLNGYGNPASGPSQERLKSYNVTFIKGDNRLVIWNN